MGQFAVHVCSALTHAQVRDDPMYNFMSPKGMLATLNILRQLKSGAIVLMAPPCSSWVLLRML